MPNCAPGFHLTVFMYNPNQKDQVLGFTLIAESVLANNIYLSFYDALIWDNHCDYMSKYHASNMSPKYLVKLEWSCNQTLHDLKQN